MQTDVTMEAEHMKEPRPKLKENVVFGCLTTSSCCFLYRLGPLVSAALSHATSYYQSLFLPNKIFQSSKQPIKHSTVQNSWLQTPPDPNWSYFNSTLRYYFPLKGETLNCSIIFPVAVLHSDANELHNKAKASARSPGCIFHMKNKSSLFVPSLSLKGWLTVVNPHPGPSCLQPALACDLRAPSLQLCIPDTPSLRGTSEGNNQHPAPSLKFVWPKQPKRFGSISDQSRHNGTLMNEMQHNFHLWLTPSRTVSLPFESQKSEPKPKLNKSTTA